MSTTPGATHRRDPEGQSIRVRFSARARVVTALTASLSAMGLAASLAAFPAVASASGPTVFASSTSNIDIFDVVGNGYTPGGNVHVEVDFNGAAVYSTNVTTSLPSTHFICIYGGVKPNCHWVTFPGGSFSTTVSDQESGCVNPNGPAPVYVIKATDVSTGAAATTQVTGYGCIQQS